MLEHFWSSAAYRSRKKEREDKASAEQMIDAYLAWQAKNENQIIDVEMKFAFNLNGRVVKGFIDRVERTPEGNYVVIDFKTGSQSETKNTIKENIQMNVYCLAILEKFAPFHVERHSFTSNMKRWWTTFPIASSSNNRRCD